MDDQLSRLVEGPGARETARAMGPGRRLGLVVGGAPGTTLVTTDEGVDLVPGVEDAPVVVALDEDAFGDLLAERHSIFGLLYGGRLEVVHGDFGRFAWWEPALQALLYDRPVYDRTVADALADTLAERTGDGRLDRSFTLDDDEAEMAAFLDVAGFLVVRGVFAAEEVAALSAEVERLRGDASLEDSRSWWATDAEGHDVCCRLTFMNERSELVAELADDPRLARLAALSGHQLWPTPTRNDGISAVLKNPAGTTGLSDLPWHRDCGLGGHPLLCPGVLTGIQLDPADAANGQLLFLPGSHRHAGPVGEPDEAGYPTVAVEAAPGDVTVHHGHVLHAAPPPSAPDAGRRAVYVSFSTQELLDAIPEGHAYNDVIYAGGDGHVRNAAEQSLA